MAQSTFCPRCGTPRAGSFRYCRSCGLDYENPTDAPVAPLASEPATVDAALPSGIPAPNRALGRSRGRLLLGALLVLIAVGGGILVVSRLQVQGILDSTRSLLPGATSTPPPVQLSAVCTSELESLVEALTDLDSRLDIGLSFSEYSERVGDAKVAYDRIDASVLDATCIEAIGTPAETALNAYIDAYNDWNDCIQDSDCSTDSIEPTLQGHWSKATSLLDAVQAKLR